MKVQISKQGNSFITYIYHRNADTLKIRYEFYNFFAKHIRDEIATKIQILRIQHCIVIDATSWKKELDSANAFRVRLLYSMHMSIKILDSYAEK